MTGGRQRDSFEKSFSQGQTVALQVLRSKRVLGIVLRGALVPHWLGRVRPKMLAQQDKGLGALRLIDYSSLDAMLRSSNLLSVLCWDAELPKLSTRLRARASHYMPHPRVLHAHKYPNISEQAAPS